MENKNEAVIANYIEKMMGERRQKIFESDEYIQQDNGDLDYLEERYSSLKIPYVIRRVVDDYIACLESRDERYADMSYVAGMGDAISLLTKMGMLNNQEQPLSIKLNKTWNEFKYTILHIIVYAIKDYIYFKKRHSRGNPVAQNYRV